MTQLVELGAIQLIEMGRPSLGQATLPPKSPILDLFNIVDYIENPYKGMELEAGETITPKERAIAERLHTISKVTRKALVNPQGLRGLGGYDLYAEMAGLAVELDRIVNDPSNELGKSFKKRLKKIGKKITKVVKSPAFLSVVGVAANIIPGVGQLASAALLTTAGIMAKKQQEAKAKKEMKKAEAQAAAEAAKQDELALNAYYNQYHVDYLDPFGYTPNVWSSLDVAKKRIVLEQLATGTLQPYVTPQQAQQLAVTNPTAQQEVVQAAGMSQAMQQTYGSALPGQGISAPPQLQPQVNHAASEYQRQIESVGKENFLATAMKSVGQGSAISDFFKGAGAELPEGLSDMFAKFTGKAKEAGLQDLKNTGAAVGALDTTEGILSAGAGGIPWGVVGITAGGLVIVGGIVYVITRRS